MTPSAASSLWWIASIVLMVGLLAVDLIVHRRSRSMGRKRAGLWSAGWVVVSLAFGAVVWTRLGSSAGEQFLTAYLLEKSLSVDNLMAIWALFLTMQIPAAQQHKVLFWGIFGALALRALMIFAGAELLLRFHWILYGFGAILLYSSVRLARAPSSGDVAPGLSGIRRFVARIFPTTSTFDGAKFFTRENGRRVATPLFLALVLVESTDFVFALDSIPAAFGVTTDPFLIFTSNAFAVMGLRELYFLLAEWVERLRFLKIGLSAILAFVGLKMLLSPVVEISPGVSLVVTLSLLAVAILASLVFHGRAGTQRRAAH